MNALRSVLVDVLKELPDLQLLRIVRAAPPEVLRGLVEVALAMEDEAAEPPPVDASPPKSKRKAAATQEDAPGPRPTKVEGRVAELLELLSSGPKTTSELTEAMGLSSERLRFIANAAGRRLRKIGGGKGKGEATWEAARK